MFKESPPFSHGFLLLQNGVQPSLENKKSQRSVNNLKKSEIARRIRGLAIWMVVFLFMETLATGFAALRVLHAMEETQNHFQLLSAGLELIEKYQETEFLKQNQGNQNQLRIDQHKFLSGLEGILLLTQELQSEKIQNAAISNRLQNISKKTHELKNPIQLDHSQRKSTKHNPIKILLHEITLELNFLQKDLIKSGALQFDFIYKQRFQFFIASTIAAIIFSITMLYFGFSLARRIEGAFASLIQAIHQVQSGAFDVQLTTTGNDDIVRLSKAFLGMVERIKNSMNRSKNLQDLAGDISAKNGIQIILKAAMDYGVNFIDAAGAAVFIFDEKQKTYQLIAKKGRFNNFFKQIEYLSEDQLANFIPSSLNKTIRSISSKKDLLDQFSFLKAERVQSVNSLDIIPIYSNEKNFGLIFLLFSESWERNSEYFEYLNTLRVLISESCQRAYHYENTLAALNLRDEFIALAAHELKTPITSLKLQLQIADRRAQSPNFKPEADRSAFRMAIKQVDRLIAIVDDLLDMDRIRGGRIFYRFEKNKMREMITEILDQFSGIFTEKHIKIDLLAPEEIEIQCDRFRIEQVLTNLISNAVKYGQGRPIQVKLLKNSDKIKISVTDHGIGIPKDKLLVIFDRFERAVGDALVSGLGLGLYISRNIIKAHGGKIWAESTEKEGTIFYVELPIYRGSTFQSKEISV